MPLTVIQRRLFLAVYKRPQMLEPEWAVERDQSAAVPWGGRRYE
jgi:hypothetical protein